VASPVLDDDPGFLQGAENLAIEQLIAEDHRQGPQIARGVGLGIDIEQVADCDRAARMFE
jgi:hypothetical protein